jgi:hypothetical protein
MTQLAAMAFDANAKSTVVMNRQLTEAESSSIVTIKQNAISAGEQVSLNTTTTDPETGDMTNTSYYSNITTANAVVAAYLAFVPAPISAVATAI